MARSYIMAISKEKKQEVVSKLKGAVEDSPSLVFVNFHGLGVSEATNMRSALSNEGVGYYVAKKTLVGRALDELSIEGERPIFEGELALAYAESADTDLTAPARAVYGFQKDFSGAVQIVGGIFEGVYKSREEMTEIAEIPSLQTLRGMFVNVINSPLQGLVIALNAISEKKSA